MAVENILSLFKFLQERIDLWVDRRAMSRAQFYQAIGMSPGGYRMAMQRHSLDFRQLFNIAKTLNVEWYDLLPVGDPDPESIRARLNELSKSLAKPGIMRLDSLVEEKVHRYSPAKVDSGDMDEITARLDRIESALAELVKAFASYTASKK